MGEIPLLTSGLPTAAQGSTTGSNGRASSPPKWPPEPRRGRSLHPEAKTCYAWEGGEWLAVAKGDMREHSIKCDNCGREGRVTVTELDSKLVGTTEGFRYRDSAVSCDHCRINVFEIPK